MLRCVMALLAGPLLAAAASATTYVVNADGTGDFHVIQAAVDFAIDGDVIELGSGIFRGAGNRDIDYRGKEIAICSQSGIPETCIVDCEGSESDRHRGFRLVSGEGPGAELRGLTVRGGFQSVGAAVHIQNPCGHAPPGPTIADCVFTENHATDGGGALTIWYSSLTAINCRFDRNTCEGDGGVFLSLDGELVFRECEFTDNEGTHGGGVGWANGETAEFDDCVFARNVTNARGGGFHFLAVEAVFNDCVFSENQCRLKGGALQVENSVLVMSGCALTGNIAGEMGGALMLLGSESSAELLSCTFVGNAGYYMGGDGGSAITFHETGPIAVDNCIFAFQVGPLPAIDESRWFGMRDIPQLSCCDIYGNEGGDWVGAIADQYGINGNICEDPLFCDYPGGDYTLSCASPCAPGYNPECGLIGAWPVGCGASPVNESTWGGVKVKFGREKTR